MSDPKNVGDPVDMHVCLRMREIRIMQGVSQLELATALGVTEAQVYKYEKGSNRLSAAKLWAAAKCLKVPMRAFFEELPGEWREAPPKYMRESSSRTRECFKTARMLLEINDPERRQAIRQLIRHLMSKSARKRHSRDLEGM